MAITIRQRVTSATLVLAAVGFAALPAFASAASQTGSTTVSADIGSAISLTTSTTVAISLTPTAAGVVSSASDTVTVNTNNSTGYDLTLANADATTTLDRTGGGTIAAHAGTFAAPTALANNTWGYRVVSVGGFGASAYTAETNNTSSTSTWAGVPTNASPATLKSTSGTATNDVTTVWYGVRANSSLANGTYTDTVTYSAVTKP